MLGWLGVGVCDAFVLCRSGVHAKLGVSMGGMVESELSRLKRSEPAQGGNTAGKSSRVKQ